MTELPGNRETAYRVFAAEFDDATVDFQESDEERAPNYVITPTGARANRLFVVGVLTEIESVNDDVLRARIVDPTGAFVVYAGQYQPDEMAALERLDPPAFVAVTGKARTFSPDDSDRVFTSIRPESINVVDAETRDRWVVRTAEHTVERVRTLAAAAERPEIGDDLVAALEASDVPAPTASGVSLALEHYGTTPAYLAGMRDLAIDAAEVVAGERDEVTASDGSPDAAGDGTHTYADLAVDLDAPAAAATATAATETADAPAAGQTSDVGEADDTATPTADAAAPEETTATDAPSAGEAASADETATVTEDERADRVSDADADVETERDVETESDPATEPTVDAEPATESEPATDTVGADAGGADGADDTDEPGDDDDGGVGDFEPGDLGSEADATSDQMYEFDEGEREEIEEEFGTEFSSGNDVPDPEESDLDAPDPDPDAAVDGDADDEAVPVDDQTTADADATEADATDDSDATTDQATTDGADEDGDEPESETADAEPDDDDGADDAAEDVDLDAFVMEAMRDLADGDGVERSALLDHVSAETGADADAVDDAVQDALMGGQCYEPEDGVLKPI
jgi:hypothetical protein